jgi:hypothetical protein
MADPIPRNSRADETAEYRRAAQERRANRPLFGEGFGGGLRARVENPPNEPPRPRAVPENPFARPPQARPNPPPARPAPPPPVAQNPFRVRFEQFVEALRQDRVLRPPQARRVAPRSTTRSTLIAGSIFAFFMAAISARSMFGAATSASSDPALSGPLVASAPMIPVDVPAETCSVELTDLQIHADAATQYAGHALAADLQVAMHGCDRQMFRYAIWIFQAENVPMLAPDADNVFRSPIGQLTAQSLNLVEVGTTSTSLAIGIPHNQFPTAVGLPVWLTVGVQVWPEGRPAPGGSMHLQQVFFTRAE